MTKPHTATDRGLASHFKVRVVLPGAILHLASLDEPKLVYGSDRIDDVVADWLGAPDDYEYGDTLGYIHWPSVTAITWRWNP